MKPVDGSGGKGIVVGPYASPEQRSALRTVLLHDPRGWIAQPVVQLSTIPTLTDEGFRPRHADLRPFAVNDGNSVWVLPGGLTRVALPEGQLVVNSSQGGGSKDTWVLDDSPAAPVGPSNAADDLFATPSSFLVAENRQAHGGERLTPLHTSPADEDMGARHQQQQ